MLEFSIKKSDVLRPLSKAQTIIEKKNIMAIINNIYLYAEPDKLVIEATDLEISYRASIPCNLISQGAITVNANKLYEIVKEFPSDEIHFKETENSWLQIGSNDKAIFKIGGTPPDEFPQFRRVEENNAITIRAKDLNEMITKTVFAASSEAHKFSLAGVYMEQESWENSDNIVLRMVASNGHRLALQDKDIQGAGLDMDQGILIPKKGANEIRKLLEDHEEVVFGIDEKFCFLKGGEEFLVIRLIEGKFPNYRAIIPQTKERSFKFPRKDMYSALKRISILASDDIFRSVMAFIRPGEIEIESLKKESGEAKEKMAVEYQGEPFELAFNAKYMMDALSVMNSETVEVISNDASSPCLIVGEQDPGYMALIMPMTLRDE